MSPQKILDGLHPYEYEHPFDSKALGLVQGTPGLDAVIRQFHKHGIERLSTVQYTGSNLRIRPESYPKIYTLLDRVCNILNMPDRPNLYLKPGDLRPDSEFPVGIDSPIVILTSEEIKSLTDDELLYVIGREMGHIKSQHTLYHAMAQFFPAFTDVVGQATFGIGKLVSSPLQLALQRWSRMSKLTADRAGLLSCQNFETAIKVMMKWAGLPDGYFDDMKLKSFLDQAKKFEELDFDLFNKALKFYLGISNTHPWIVVRSAELLKWVESGEYQQVLDRQTVIKQYIRFEDTLQFCRNCNYRLRGTEKFCNSCGQQLRS
ncbi:MAG: M48 family metallopeptidase [Cyanobacteriota bacterium]|nr:M48 family metallopeptidase [Cyanobacteriota bacterium]